MEIEQPINDKVKEYCHYCVCKSCEDVQRLQAENVKLNAIIDSYQPKIQALKDENERLKEENFNFEEIVKLCRCEQYKQTLQEIKTIVKNICDGCTSECDCDEDCNYFLITEQLTKAEEE